MIKRNKTEFMYKCCKKHEDTRLTKKKHNVILLLSIKKKFRMEANPMP